MAVRSRTSSLKTAIADGNGRHFGLLRFRADCEILSDEPGRDAVRALAREMGRVVTSGVAVAEVSAAFHRKLREDAVDHDVFEALMGQFEQDLEAGLWYLAGPSEELFRQVHAFFATLDGAVFVRSLDALHLITAQSEGFARLYSNDRGLLGACAHANLEGIDPVATQRQSRR